MVLGMIELVVVMLAALVLLAVIGGLVFLIVHVARLSQRVRRMETQLREMGEEQDAERG